MDTNLSFVGTRSSGKTTCAGLLYMTAIDLSLSGPFKVRTQQKSMDIMRISAGLQNGVFPPPNPPGDYFQADISLEFRRWSWWPWSKRRVNLGFVDVAGEELAKEMHGFADDSVFTSEAAADLDDINRYIMNASGFIIIADLKRVLGLEHEDQGIGYTDAALAQYVSFLFDHKSKSPTSPPFRGIAMVLTKYDQVEGALARENLALADRRHFLSFMERRMPLTYVAIKGNIDLDKLSFFHSGVTMVRTEGATSSGAGPLGPLSETSPLDSPDERASIRVNRDTGRPEYTRDQYERLLRWIQRTFAQ